MRTDVEKGISIEAETKEWMISKEESVRKIGEKMEGKL